MTVRGLRPTAFDPPAPRWTVAWFNGKVNKENGFLDKAISEFRSILEDRYPELDERGFDFSKDYEVINELGQTLMERAKMEWGEANKPKALAFLAVRGSYLVPLAQALNVSGIRFLAPELCLLLLAGGTLVGCLGGLVAASGRA